MQEETFESNAELSADYVNTAVEAQLTALLVSPDEKHLADFLAALATGSLFIDVTGTVKSKKGPRVRTTRTTKGQLVLPLFTSMQHLRSAINSGGRRTKDEPKGVLMPALDALRLIETDRFVAIEINPGKGSLVVLRKYVQQVLA